jgi:hypothetical protein
MKMIKQIALFGSLALLGAGCAIPGMPASTTSTVVDTTSDTKVSMCAQTPQVFFFNRLAFSAAEISQINANIVAPLVDYYRTTPPDGEYQVVSITIERTATGILVEAIVDQPDSNDPISHGFVHNRAKDGSYPMWYPDEVPPEYRG